MLPVPEDVQLGRLSTAAHTDLSADLPCLSDCLFRRGVSGTALGKRRVQAKKRPSGSSVHKSTIEPVGDTTSARS